MPRAPSNGEALLPIARQALTHWDLEERELRLISLSENAVFRLDASDGGTYIIRIHRPGYSSLKALESELTWTAALSEAGLDAPEAVHTRRGEGYATVSLDDGSRRHVGVVRWIEGTLLSAILDREDGLEAIAGHYRRLGGLAARIHHDLAIHGAPLSLGGGPHRAFRDGIEVALIGSRSSHSDPSASVIEVRSRSSISPNCLPVRSVTPAPPLGQSQAR